MLQSRTIKTNRKTLIRVVESVAKAEKAADTGAVAAIAATGITVTPTTASTGAPVVIEVTEITDGAAVVVEIDRADAAAVKAGKGAVGVEKREVIAQNARMSIAEDGPTIKKAAVRGEAKALMARTRRQNMQLTHHQLRL